MNYKIIKREGFSVIGKMYTISCKDGEHLRRIPQIWKECGKDGTIERLCTLSRGKNLLGIIMDMNNTTQELTYGIAVESNIDSSEEGLTVKNISPQVWAVFISVGSLPNSIQDVWSQIFEEFFPNTVYQHAGGPGIEAYPQGDTSSSDYQCEVWIPVIEKQLQRGW